MKKFNPLTAVLQGKSGTPFKRLSTKLSVKGIKNPEALAAWIGRKKYGKVKFQELCNKGK